MRTTLLLALATITLAACSVDPVVFTTGDGGGSNHDGGDDIDAPTGPLTILTSADTLTITEGQMGTFTVRLSVPPPDAVIVTLSSSNDTRLGFMPGFLLFSPSSWSTPQTVTLTGKSDVDVSDESVQVSLVSPAAAEAAMVDVTVDDDDGLALVLTPTTLDVGEGSTGTVNAHLTAQPTADVVVDVASSNPLVAAIAPATLTFTPANWMVDQSVLVNGVQDLDTAAGTATVNFTSPDLTAAAVTVQVADDDVLGITTSVSGVSLTEGATGTFTVQLSQLPSGTVTVNVASMSPLVATATPATLTFTTVTWNVAQTVTVTALADDDVANGAGSIALTATGLTPRSVAVSVTDDDVQSITATPTSLSVTEGGVAGVANVRLAFRPAADVTIAVTSQNPALATASPATLTFSPSNYMVTQAVSVVAVQDPDAAGGSTVLHLESPSAGLVRDLTVAVTDDDVLGIETSATTVSVTEGGTATFMVRLTAQPLAGTTLAIATSDLTAASANPTSLSFTTSNWNTFQSVTVTGVQDVDLAGETVTFTLSGVGMPSANVTANVADNDSQVIVASAPSVTVTEGSSTTVGVTLGFQPAGNVTVNVASTATLAATATPATLTFTPANYATAQNVTIAGVEDADANPGSAMVNLTATGAASAAVTVTVTDNDALNLDVTPASVTIGEAGTGTLMVRLTAMPAASTTVTVASSDTGAATAAPASLTFTTANWNAYQSVTVSGVDDADTASESVTVTFTSPPLTARTATVTVTDNDVLGITASAPSVSLTEGGTATFTARLSAMPAGTTTVTVSSTDSGAATAAPTSLTFTTANWMTPQTVTVTAIQDPDLLNETVNLSLTAPGVTTATVGAMIADDDMQIVQVSSTSATVVEGGTTSVGVTLGFQPSANVVVSVSSGTPAVATVAPASLTFTAANYATAQNITITGTEDANAIANSATITLSAPSATGASVMVTANDNDVLGIDVTPTAATIGEATPSATLQVRLTAQPTASTTVTVASSDTGAASVTPAALTFTTANYATYQNVTVAGVNDGDTSNESVTVTLASAPLLPRTAAITVIDDDFCGNGTCSGGETCATCPQDCGNCCGNGTCDNGETCATCANDCFSCCGNGVCGPGETCSNCSQDCGACCGNGTCDGGETCSTCPQDCGNCCGNGACDGGETCSTCAQDCGNCCGNGACDNGEDCFSCSNDCGICNFCGDGICDQFNGEDCFNCPQDCSGTQSFRFFGGPPMLIPPGCAICGDGICQFGECCQFDCGFNECLPA